MNAISNEESFIFATLRQFAESYARKDLKGVLATFTRNHKDIVVIGAGSTEPLTDLELVGHQLHYEFVEWGDISIDPCWIGVSVRGDVAWVTTINQTKSCFGDRREGLRGRFTAVLLKEDKCWRIAQFHFSFACNKHQLLGQGKATIQRDECNETIA